MLWNFSMVIGRWYFFQAITPTRRTRTKKKHVNIKWPGALKQKAIDLIICSLDFCFPSPTEVFSVDSMVKFLPQQSLLSWLNGKEPTCRGKRLKRPEFNSLVRKEIAAYTSILAWKTPWTEEPGGLPSKGLQRVKHDRAAEHTCISPASHGQTPVCSAPASTSSNTET